ncbi:glycosyltransferase family 1 protein [Microbispora triticiradicis]|uniref:glycogen phosphorylase n=3 Tax=Microbispora TaxID=2005 RepID=A0ABY3LTP4_9ACTN|nr:MULTISPECIES: alpha-glucan family phosphorylase [Microbispora]RGA05716.1 glycosyltransferase family 1 protein [Microbispora triticiradicis]TLP51936.1 glycosyltransferase family 1 protein [Microbispora fusca]TYB52470.1 glycosyltransferase family 1 protein [Microbispora tritici]GLW24549.1 alpha-1,4 glucan phosphorylase [Microbispora amethystogenes]
MRAIRRFTVRTVLPSQLAPLGELVQNLRWSWHPETMDLFAEVDPEVWERVDHDPVALLGAVEADRLRVLAQDRRFLRRLADAADDLREYMTAPRWYQSLEAAPKAIGYFSPEYGIAAALPQYSGGLGILAGDHLKAASDLGVPILGVGLLYRHGYFTQSLSAEGWQLEHYPSLDPGGLPLTLLKEQDGAPARVAISLAGGRTLHAQVWVAQVGRVPLLLLDSDVAENDAVARDVTDRLYGGGGDHRLMQELLLGIGGVRAIRAYCRITGHPEPEVFHTNEGHAGFLGLERIRELTEARLSFEEALEAVRAGTVFTTHTPVPAGIDRFPAEMIARQFGGSNAWPTVSVDRILELGAEPEGPESDPAVFNMAVMGMRLAQRVNGVSELHGKVSQEMFQGLWPGFDVDEVPIGSITNGVHAPTWVGREMMELAGKELPSLIDKAQGWEGVNKLSDADIWGIRGTLRARLVEEARRRLRKSWRQRGATEAELTWVDEALDPDVLTIGFARRVPSYKRLTLMLNQPDRLRRLLLDPDKPVQIVIAGKAHPADEGGKKLIQQIVRFADSEDVRHRIVFLPDYDMALGQLMVTGSDVWMNNPLRPLEACGTSGMKAALNGGLNLSIRDGWWDEWYDGTNGWAIPSADGVDDPERRDELEATALYDLVEREVADRFYDRAADGLPRRWLEMVKHTLSSLGPKVLAGRMLHDYVTDLYTPAAAGARVLAADGYDNARLFAAWKLRVVKAWPGVRVEHVEATGVGDTPELGAQLELRATIALGELSAEDVRVEAAYGRVGAHDELLAPCYVTLKADSVGDDGRAHYTGAVPLDRTGAFGYSVRVVPSHPLMASPAELGLVAVPEEPVGMTNGTLR